jgi:hypothetical protein
MPRGLAPADVASLRIQEAMSTNQSDSNRSIDLDTALLSAAREHPR